MNQPSLDKFLPRMEAHGIAVVNTSLVDTGEVDERNAHLVPVPANQIADELGNVKMANMVAMGAYIQALGFIQMEKVEAALKQVISPHYAHLIPKNIEALQAGAACVRGAAS